MVKKQLLRIINFWDKLWSKITWTEVIVLTIIGLLFLSYARVNLANYYVNCENQTIKLNEGINEVCGKMIKLNYGQISILTNEQIMFQNQINQIIKNQLKNGSR